MSSKPSQPSDIEIATQTKLRPISDVAADTLGIEADALELFGRHKAKISLEFLASLKERANARLILVTATHPTPRGEGKTTTVVGLGDALNRIGKKAITCIREPSLGPCFGIKGGAAGGGYAQVVPMEDINLHFTGDLHSVSLAHNLLAALVDNHIHHGNALGLDTRRTHWNRVVDINDRSLRHVVIGLGGTLNGYLRESSFDIVTASEVMAILCLSSSLEELRRRLGNIVVGHSYTGEMVRAADLKAQGSMTVLLKDALKPNLVQTLEHNPALVHGGPFANIAHGCNSVIATKAALRLADYVVTEAGFGADLGAEKFLDIKCRKAGFTPSLVVIVTTVRALQYHGHYQPDQPGAQADPLKALAKGAVNLERHIDNIRDCFQLPCLVAINRFSEDSDAELDLIVDKARAHGARAVIASHWANGGAGAEDLARAVVDATGGEPPLLQFAYSEQDPLWRKIEKVAKKIYGAKEIIADTRIRKRIQYYQECGYGHFPICIAKTQYSFSTDPRLRGAPTQHTVHINNVSLSAGAEFFVVDCGHIQTMPGLPKESAAHTIDVDKNGRISGLF